MKQEFLPAVKEKYQDKIEWRELCTSDAPENLSLLVSLSEQFEKGKPLVPSVWVGNNLLIGVTAVKAELEAAIEASLEKGSRFVSLVKIDLPDIFKRLSVFTVMGSGLIDGINPCAFAVIVFFISFLAVYGYKRKEIIYVGTSYCLAVFVTYLLIGLGFFKFIYSLEQVYLFIKLFYYLVAVFCFSLGVAALWDYFKFRKTGLSDGAILQLPKFLKKRINIIIGSALRGKKQRSAGSLMLTSFIVGFLVSLLEAVCTGQVYLPTIVFILKNTDLRLKAATYLFVYNLMFVLPLVTIFLLSLLGVSSQKLSNFLKRNLGIIKIIMASVFFLLGALILYLS